MSNFNPAPTFPLLGYANTFGDWLVSTNNLVLQNNDLSSNNFYKSTGTLYLQDANLGLQVSNNAIFGGQLESTGIGSSLTVQNNGSVGGQLYLTNTTIGLIATGGANVGGQLTTNSLSVTNNSVLNGRLTVGGNTLISNTLSVSGNVSMSNNVSILGNTTISNTVYITNNAYLANNLTITNNVYALNYMTVNLDFKANSNVYVVGDSQFANNLSVAKTTYTNVLQANSTVNTAISSVTGTNFVNITQANTAVNTTTLSVTSNSYSNNIIANNSILTPNLTVSTGILDASGTSQVRLSNIVAGTMQLNGNFVLNGQTVYASNNLTLAQGTSSLQNATFNVYRVGGANASILWNNSVSQWQMNDVVGGSFYRILTDEFKSDSLYTANTANVATSLAVYNLNQNLIANVVSLNSQVTANVISLQNQITANVSSLQNQLTANVTNLQTQITANVTNINAVDATQNTSIQYSFNQANSGFTQANSAFTKANNSIQSVSGTSGRTSTSTTGNTVSVDLVSTGVTPGTYGSSSAVPQVTIDQYGRISTATTQAINAVTSFSYNVSNYTFTIGTSSGTNFSSQITSLPNSALANYTISGIPLGSTLPTHTPGSYIDGNGYNGSAAQTWNIHASPNNTGGYIVARDGSGNFSAGYMYGTSQNADYVNNDAAAMRFHWNGQGGQPAWLWGGNDASNMYLYNPSNFNVNYATTSGTAYGGGASYQNIYYDYYNTGYYVQPRSLSRMNTVLADTLESYNTVVSYYSDDNLKTRLGNIENALDKVTSLTGFYYQANEKAQSLGYQAKREVGLSAQDTQKFAPEIIHPAPADNSYLTMDYERLIPYLVEAIKELKVQVDEIKGKL
jgi:cytoskeletal protein CcmA (bactofilin family)